MDFQSMKATFMKVRNLLRQTDRFGEEGFRWIFIYGLPRSGSTYALRQFRKISERVVGDWMLEDFALAFRRATERDREQLNLDRLRGCFAECLLDGARVGGGRMIDIAIKQQSTSQVEYDFLTGCFGIEAERKIFLFREPKGWLRSTRKKFDVSDAKATHMYLRDLEQFRFIGGRPVRYQELAGYLENIPELRDVSLESFEPRNEPSIAVPDEMTDAYEHFLETSYSKPWTAHKNLAVSEVE